MRQTGLLVATFIVTLTLLTGGFFVMQAFNGPDVSPVATPTPAPTDQPTTDPTAPRPTARPTATPTSAPTVSPTPSATPAASAAPASPSAAPATPAPATSAPAPTASPAPASIGPRQQIDVVVRGADYHGVVPAQNGVVTKNADGSVTFHTDRTLSDQLELDWQLPATAIPAGHRLLSVDVLICGNGSGDFWESYGPEGSDPVENEVVGPASDGCWHYDAAPGPDTTVKAIVRLATTMTITRVEYIATLTP